MPAQAGAPGLSTPPRHRLAGDHPLCPPLQEAMERVGREGAAQEGTALLFSEEAGEPSEAFARSLWAPCSWRC